MFLQNLKYSKKIQVLFIPVFALIAAGLVMVYDIAARGLWAEHAERLRRTAQLTENGLRTTEQEMVKLVNLFQTNRTLREYLYITSELGGDPQALRDLLEPLARSLDVEDIDVYDAHGRMILDVDIMSGSGTQAARIEGVTAGSPSTVISGFIESGGIVEAVAIGPLKDAGRTLGFLSVGRYLTPDYLDALKQKSGNELLLVKNGQVLASTIAGWTPSAGYTVKKGLLQFRDITYSVLERPISGLDKQQISVLAIALSTAELDAARSKLRNLMLGMLAIAAGLSYGLSRLFVKALVKPLRSIVAFTEKVARGELDQDLALKGNDEIAQLGTHLNEMRSTLKADRDLVRRYTTNLEQLVEERTEELHKVQAQLLHAQKMEAVGQMAGGIAHDFNNILTTILGYASLLQNKIGPADPRGQYVEQVISASRRASNLTHGLLAFSRKQVLHQKAVDLNEIIRGIEKLIERLVGEEIEVVHFLDGHRLTIMADQGQVEQVLMNLAANARDAMQKGGRVEVRTAVVQYDEQCIIGPVSREFGEYAMLSVTDTGEGIEKSVQEKIFEPFFTTKGVGKGTGLGLAMVYGIMQQHEGCITVESEVGVGTTFSLYFPLIPGRATAEQMLVPEGEYPGGSETILIGDDDENIRELLRMALADAGYRVLTATNGEEAVAQYIRYQGSVDLLLLDVVMPKQNGKEALDMIRSANSTIPAIFMSGYTDEIIKKKGVEDNGTIVLAKPLDLRDLLRTVRRVLDRRLLNSR